MVERPAQPRGAKSANRPNSKAFDAHNQAHLDFHNQHVARLSRLDLKGTGQVVDPRKINVSNVVGAVVVANLPAGPVDALDLDDLVVLDGAAEGDCEVRGAG